MMKRGLIIAALLLAFGASAQAEVIATNIGLSRATMPTGTNTYTVPAGKVLIIEHVNMDDTNSYIYHIQTFPSGGGMLSVIVEDVEWRTFSPGLLIPSGIKLNVDSPTATGLAVLYGKLIDAADLYAAVPGSFDSLYAAAGAIQGTLRLDVPRPVVARIERSADMESWSTDDSFILSAASDKQQLEFSRSSVPDAESYLRAVIRSRK